jgi:hypothetical protein
MYRMTDALSSSSDRLVMTSATNVLRHHIVLSWLSP